MLLNDGILRKELRKKLPVVRTLPGARGRAAQGLGKKTVMPSTCVAHVVSERETRLCLLSPRPAVSCPHLMHGVLEMGKPAPCSQPLSAGTGIWTWALGLEQGKSLPAGVALFL